MDLPIEVVDAVVGDTPQPVRAARPAQRRRPAKPLAALPSSTPPATDLADTAAEDHTMDTAETAANIAGDAVNRMGEQMADNGQAAFADVGGRTRDALEKGSRMAEELGAFGKGNVEALVESSRIAAKGLETLGQEAAERARRSFETATQAMKTLAATRSPTEFMKLQGDYARQMFDTMVADASRSTELMLKLAGDVAQPLSNRVALAAEKIKVAA
jgi:phasin family protein